LLELLKNLRKEGHRVLIFSMSKKILNILEAIIKSGYLGLLNGEPVKHMRIDGDTEISSREQICVDFNNDTSIFVGLLTTKVGGFGLNLIGADRAVILDPDWNPANDNQAVDRVFRIGQKRDVIVYRLLTMGTIEEKIYRRQIYKKGMSLATIDNGGNSQQDFDKYFSTKDLFELF
jgi:DNA excision repair protein ERCC-6